MEEVLSKYPLAWEKTEEMGIGEKDIRVGCHPMLRDGVKSSEMDVAFIGTASCTPGVTRGVSCTALRLNWRRNTGSLSLLKVNGDTGAPPITIEDSYNFLGGTWLFDCGECTQLQIQKTSTVKPGKITKIFITHSHGDHSFGLPGLLCLMGQDRPKDAPPVEIYGPEGLRMWLRIAIRYSVSRIVPNYRVHELKNIPMAPEWTMVRGRDSRCRFYYDLNKQGQTGPWLPKGTPGDDPSSFITFAPTLHLPRDPNFGEIHDGTNIYPDYHHPLSSDNAPVWRILDEQDVAVHAAPMSHGIPCIGYVVTESDKPGRLKPELVAPVVQRNSDALKRAGVKTPMKILALIKNLHPDKSFKFPDGTVIRQKDVVQPPRKGRKIVICGDTADSRAIAGLAQGADLLIHEATNAYLQGFDKETTLQEVTNDAKVHGHSTPDMAGQFAKVIGAKRLILNHFSSRYKGDPSLESLSIMTRIEKQAIEASGLNETHVAAAWDFFLFPIPAN